MKSSYYGSSACIINGSLQVSGGELLAPNAISMPGMTTYDQGLHIQWNCNNGDGRTWIANRRGAYPGGISFGTYENPGGYTQQMFISTSNQVSVSGPYPLIARSIGSTGGTNSYNLKKLTVTAGAANYIFNNAPINCPQVIRVYVTCPNNGAGGIACGAIIWYALNKSLVTPVPVYTNYGTSTNITWTPAYFDGTYYNLGFTITGTGSVDVYVMYEIMKNYSG
jgi:hypothetical protein